MPTPRLGQRTATQVAPPVQVAVRACRPQACCVCSQVLLSGLAPHVTIELCYPWLRAAADAILRPVQTLGPHVAALGVQVCQVAGTWIRSSVCSSLLRINTTCCCRG
jgi:hypothetical protein